MAFDEFTKEALQNIVSTSKTFAEIFRRANRANQSYRTLLNRLDEDKIDYSHIPRGLDANSGRFFPRKSKVDYSKLFTENSEHARCTAKKWIMRDNLIPYKCDECGMGPEWNGKKLTLRLDHQNGIRNDHRIENLRFLCPNCDSQSETYGGRNIKRKKKRYYCKKCGIEVTSSKGYCEECARFNRRKCERPSKEKLTKMVWEIPMRTIAKQYGVSDKAIAKWCKKYDIKTPGPGYWQKHANKQ